jgi:hypothetical protein
MEGHMKVRLKIMKSDAVVYDAGHEINDAEQFGKAFSGVWRHLHAKRLEQAHSVGEAMENINDSVLGELNDTVITFETSN